MPEAVDKLRAGGQVGGELDRQDTDDALGTFAGQAVLQPDALLFGAARRSPETSCFAQVASEGLVYASTALSEGTVVPLAARESADGE
ncbi:hypothetical protein [Kitasatospora purpeofusca]|uniref:hypothetical protein n=1 Tax=Kitasatospora purpeofusca TaxID=67352 RepID=UPI003F4AA9CB